MGFGACGVRPRPPLAQHVLATLPSAAAAVARDERRVYAVAVVWFDLVKMYTTSHFTNEEGKVSKKDIHMGQKRYTYSYDMPRYELGAA